MTAALGTLAGIVLAYISYAVYCRYRQAKDAAIYADYVGRTSAVLADKATKLVEEGTKDHAEAATVKDSTSAADFLNNSLR